MLPVVYARFRVQSANSLIARAKSGGAKVPQVGVISLHRQSTKFWKRVHLGGEATHPYMCHSSSGWPICKTKRTSRTRQKYKDHLFQVSWLRHEGSALLAVDNFLYSTSHRIKVFHNNNEQEWSLSINPVELSDAGIYECQIGTTPHKAHFMAVDVIGMWDATVQGTRSVSKNIFFPKNQERPFWAPTSCSSRPAAP